MQRLGRIRRQMFALRAETFRKQPMTPAQLQAWRQRLGLTAKAAAQALGLSQNGYAAYERGWVAMTDGTHRFAARPIPRHVALACERLEHLHKEQAR